MWDFFVVLTGALLGWMGSYIEENENICGYLDTFDQV